MANPEHLGFLKSGVAVWNKWRVDQPHQRPGLSGADLKEASLAEADLRGVDLRRADLQVASLYGANLSNADLRGADLRGASLHSANLFRADLRQANLSWYLPMRNNPFGTDLTRSNLTRADLRGANLNSAHLDQATLHRTMLDGADLTNARFEYTIVTRTDLSGVIGLATIRHLAPSTIGLDTLMLSRGKVPDVFLRGVGLPDDFLQFTKSAFESALQFYSCFISYTHTDKPFARRLHDALQSEGVRCWLDEKQVLPGDDLHHVVDEALRLYDKVLLCCSKDSLSSWWVDTEFRKSLMREERLSKERGGPVLAVIPLDLDGRLFDPAWLDWKKDILTSRLVADFRNWSSDDAEFKRQMDLVIRALRADAGARQQPPPPML